MRIVMPSEVVQTIDELFPRQKQALPASLRRVIALNSVA